MIISFSNVKQLTQVVNFLDIFQYLLLLINDFNISEEKTLLYTFHLKTYNTYYLIPLLTKYYTLLQKQYHLERKTTSTKWQHKTENTNIELHVTTLETKIAHKLHATANTLL